MGVAGWRRWFALLNVLLCIVQCPGGGAAHAGGAANTHSDQQVGRGGLHVAGPNFKLVISILCCNEKFAHAGPRVPFFNSPLIPW